MAVTQPPVVSDSMRSAFLDLCRPTDEEETRKMELQEKKSALKDTLMMLVGADVATGGFPGGPAQPGGKDLMKDALMQIVGGDDVMTADADGFPGSMPGGKDVMKDALMQIVGADVTADAGGLPGGMPNGKNLMKDTLMEIVGADDVLASFGTPPPEPAYPGQGQFERPAEVGPGGYASSGTQTAAARGARARGKAVEVDVPMTERTTVMLRNIPNKYTQRMLLGVIVDLGFPQSTFNFFYLPIDFRNKCNVGYMFINFLEHGFAEEFFKVMNGLKLRAFNSEKVCAVSWARVQGRDKNVEHYRNSPIAGVPIPQYRPLIFDDGIEKQLPEPDGPLARVRLRVPKGTTELRRNRKAAAAKIKAQP